MQLGRPQRRDSCTESMFSESVCAQPALALANVAMVRPRLVGLTARPP